MNATVTPPAPTAPPAGEVDSRRAYTSFAVAYLLGHGTLALSTGADPLLALPRWLPIALLATGLLTGVAMNIVATTRAQRGADEQRRRAEKLVGTAWATAFVALFLAITGLSATDPDLQNALWPAGSVLVVGLITLAEGAMRTNTLHYTLGSTLALIAGAALFLDPTGIYTVLALAGGTAYATAAVLEHRRLA